MEQSVAKPRHQLASDIHRTVHDDDLLRRFDNSMTSQHELDQRVARRTGMFRDCGEIVTGKIKTYIVNEHAASTHERLTLIKHHAGGFARDGVARFVVAARWMWKRAYDNWPRNWLAG